MQSEEIRQKFLKFFKDRGHQVVPSSPLVTDDSSVLFTTAGMQQFKPYYLGVKDPIKDFGSKNTVSVQKSVRTSDIEEVGDERHLTFFEMLGNFSFGGYWKKEAIEYAHEFVTKEMGLTIDYVTIFEGEEGVPRDIESEKIWKSIDPNIVVKAFGRADNFWGPTGIEGPCGPTTEIYVGGIEIWNIVFNEFYQNADKSLRPLDIKGIDTGMGLERLAMVSQSVSNIFETDLFIPLIEILPTAPEKICRIISDHFKTSVFMIADGVEPSNKERGYVLRRLLRRAMTYAKINSFPSDGPKDFIEAVINIYKDFYPNLETNKEKIIETIYGERQKFGSTLDRGLKEFERLKEKGSLNGEMAFNLYQTYGFPFELTKELAVEKGIRIDEKDFEEKLKVHQELSRSSAELKFKGGLAGHSEKEIRYHTATHLLHQALRDVLGTEVSQKGSNITSERLRFDFAFPRKMTDEEKQKVESIVNEKISEGLSVNKIILPRSEAEKTGALHFFGDKYGDEVSVYFIGESLDSAYSKEFCGGPHVSNISELGKFKIQKEEAVSAGVRRIKAILE